jgi:hypothetical protein
VSGWIHDWGAECNSFRVGDEEYGKVANKQRLRYSKEKKLERLCLEALNGKGKEEAVESRDLHTGSWDPHQTNFSSQEKRERKSVLQS